METNSRLANLKSVAVLLCLCFVLIVSMAICKRVEIQITCDGNQECVDSLKNKTIQAVADGNGIYF